MRPTSSPTGRAVEGGEGLVDAHEAQVAIDEGQADRRRREHRVQQAQRALGAVVQARVVDGQGAALGQRYGEGQIGLRVVAPGAGRQQRHRAEHPTAGRQRHDQVRLGRQALDQLALMVLDRLVDGGADVGGQDRLTRLGDPARLRGALLLAPPGADLEQRGLERGIRIAAGELALALAEVERAGRRTNRRPRAPRGGPPRAASSRSRATWPATRWRSATNSSACSGVTTGPADEVSEPVIRCSAYQADRSRINVAMLLGVRGGGPEVVDLRGVRALDAARDGPHLDGLVALVAVRARRARGDADDRSGADAVHVVGQAHGQACRA